MAPTGATTARCRNLSVQWSRRAQAGPDPDPPKPAIDTPDHDGREGVSLVIGQAPVELWAVVISDRAGKGAIVF